MPRWSRSRSSSGRRSRRDPAPRGRPGRRSRRPRRGPRSGPLAASLPAPVLRLGAALEVGLVVSDAHRDVLPGLLVLLPFDFFSTGPALRRAGHLLHPREQTPELRPELREMGPTGLVHEAGASILEGLDGVPSGSIAPIAA